MKKESSKLNLQRFLPYRLTKLSGVISRSLAERYSRQFDLTIQEWRILAILGEKPGLTAREVGVLASLDKVNMSRATEKLEKSGRITRQVVAEDRRAFSLILTEDGKAVLEKIIPLASEYEDLLLEEFSPSEIEMLDGFLNRLDKRADELIPHLKKNSD
ncbi:MarR family winged helix-turn-helix transcriptional regulator [Sneathiella aquimaris]|uniref:MarR family winged helix-turn-helix transcriptional regulator n=1 Tax=Sneathiella aquimaris TaxID=2599305 RepID=UPI00146C9B1D|nr:MarR family transcriptional regulator [Sneathiella aquimaris]